MPLETDPRAFWHSVHSPKIRNTQAHSLTEPLLGVPAQSELSQGLRFVLPGPGALACGGLSAPPDPALFGVLLEFMLELIQVFRVFQHREGPGQVKGGTREE